MSGNLMLIGQVARQTGCKVETIRFYEKERLLPEPARTEGGNRLYTTELVSRLVFIRRCRELGFTMNEIRQLLSLVDEEEVSCDGVKAIADSHLKDVRDKIADLKKMERTLQQLSKLCPGGAKPDCPIIESLQAK
jgi:MerR family transcriptional regulator, mercuric resistance operon regulatory protein